MRARIGFLCIFLLTSGTLFSVSRTDFDRVVDFSITLKSLNDSEEGSGTMQRMKERFCLLNGTISSIIFLDANEQNFKVQIELISGEWIGLEEVRSYSSLVNFSGAEFFKIFPAKAPKNPAPELVLLNSRVLVVAKPLERVQTAGGEKKWLLEGSYIRVVR